MDLLKLLETHIQKQAVGTLTLGRQNNFRELFLQGSSVYLIGDQFTGKVAVERLHETGIVGARVTRQGIEQLILRANLKKRLLPVLLHEQGLLDDEGLRKVAHEHLLEEILIQVSKYSGTFLFQEGRVPEYVLKGDEITTRVPVDLQQVLDELRQRSKALEEIQAAVPSRDEVFVLTERGIALKEESRDSLLIHQLFGLADGMRTLNAILEDSYIYEHHLLRFLVQSLEQGLVKKRDVPELKGIRIQDLKPPEAVRLLPILRSAVKYAVDEVPVREQLACALELAGRPEEAVIHYNFLGDSYYRLGEPAKAIAAYHRALEIRPTELHVRDKLVAIYREQAHVERDVGNRSKAVERLLKALFLNPSNLSLFTELAHWHIQDGRTGDLSTLCDRMIAASKELKSPDIGIQACRYAALNVREHSVFRKKLVNLYLDFGRPTEAVSELQVLAQSYLKAQDLGRTREIIEKLRRVEGGGPVAAGIERVVNGQRKRRKTRAAVRLVCVLILVVAGYQAWSYFLWRGLLDQELVAEASVPTPDAPLILEKSEDEARWETILQNMERYQRDFPFSLWVKDAAAFSRELSERLAQRRAVRETHVRGLIEEAAAAANEGEREVARTLLARVLAAGADVPHRKDAVALDRRAASIKASARELLAEAEAHRIAERWTEVFRVHRRILDELPRSKAAGRLQLPVSVISLPPGAKVRREGAEAGFTPLVEWIDPGSSSELDLELDGFLGMRVVVAEGDRGEKRVTLFKRPLWTKELGKRPSVAPTPWEEGVACGLDSGRLRTFDTQTGEERWPSWALQGDRLVAPIHASRTTFYALTSSARLRVADIPARGQDEGPRWRAEITLPSLASGLLLPIQDGRLLLVGTLNGEVHLIATRELTRQGAIPVGAEPALAIEDGAAVYVATRDGGVHRLSPSTLSIHWSQKPAGDGAASWMVVGTKLVGLTRKNELMTLEAATGQVTERLSLAGDSSAVLVAESKEVFVLSSAGILSVLDPLTGKALRSIAGAPRGSLRALPGTALLVHAEGKACILLDAGTLEPRWTAGLASPLAQATGTAAEVILTTESGQLTMLRR